MESFAFATLTPANALARLAFSDQYDTTLDGQTTTQYHHLRRMRLQKPQQEYDPEVLQFNREVERQGSPDEFTDLSLTEPNTDTEQGLREFGMVWVGYFFFDLGFPPIEIELGWKVGKGQQGAHIGRSQQKRNAGVDLALCTRPFAKKYRINVSTVRARFNLAPSNGTFFIAGISRSQLAPLKVNGVPVTREIFALNQYHMRITFDTLEYVLEYTNFARTQDYINQRRAYLQRFTGHQWCPLFETPTPVPNTRTIGPWTLANPLGKGARGRVFQATNQRNEVAAVKVLERTSKNADDVDTEVSISAAVTKLAKERDEDGRIVRQIDVLYASGKSLSPDLPFDEVAIILQPMTPETFHNLRGDRSSR